MIVTLDLSECGVLGRRKCIVTNNLDHKYVPVPVPLNLSECEGVLSAPGGGVSDQKGAVRGILQLLVHLATK